MSDDETLTLPDFFEAIKESLEEQGEDSAAIVTIMLPSGQMCDFEISYMGEHDPEQENRDAIWKDDTM